VARQHLVDSLFQDLQIMKVRNRYMCNQRWEPTPRSLPELLDEDSGGGNDNNISELERDLLLAFEEKEKSSSVSPLGSARFPRHSI
jgi:hypothetical protein